LRSAASAGRIPWARESPRRTFTPIIVSTHVTHRARTAPNLLSTKECPPVSISFLDPRWMGASLYRKMVRVVSASSQRRRLEPMRSGTTVLPMRLSLRTFVLRLTMRRVLSHQSDHVYGMARVANAGRQKIGEKGNVVSFRGAGRHGSLGQLSRPLCRVPGLRNLILAGCVSPHLSRTIQSCRRLLRHMLIRTTHIMLRMALFQRSHVHRWGIPRLHHPVTSTQLPSA